MYHLLCLTVHIVYRRYLCSHLPAMLLARWYDSVPWGGRQGLREVVAAPSGDTWHLTDHHSLPMEFLVCRTWDAIAVGDWVWQTRLNTLLLKGVSLIVEARALSVDVTSMLATWHKGYWKAFLARLHRREMEMEYMRARGPASGKPDWLVLHAPQFLSCRLVHLAVMYAHERDCDRLVQLWRARVVRVQRNTRLYPLVASVHCCIISSMLPQSACQVQGPWHGNTALVATAAWWSMVGLEVAG